jgi:hypothetical protein
MLPRARFLPVTHSPSAAAFRGAAGERKIPVRGAAESAAECVPVPGRNPLVAATAHGRRAAAGAGLWDEYRREISALRNF